MELIIKVGNEIPICCFKHNGEVHRVWDDAVVLEHTEDYLVVGSETACVLEGDGRFWRAKEPAITVFFTKAWFNVICMLRTNGIHYYCNIASPYILQENTVTYIDYDLDVGYNPQGQIKILDEVEYERHKREMKYSTELDFLLKDALYKVIKLCKDKKFPFKDQFVEDKYEQMKSIKRPR